MITKAQSLIIYQRFFSKEALKVLPPSRAVPHSTGDRLFAGAMGCFGSKPTYSSNQASYSMTPQGRSNRRDGGGYGGDGGVVGYSGGDGGGGHHSGGHGGGGGGD